MKNGESKNLIEILKLFDTSFKMSKLAISKNKHTIKESKLKESKLKESKLKERQESKLKENKESNLKESKQEKNKESKQEKNLSQNQDMNDIENTFKALKIKEKNLISEKHIWKILKNYFKETSIVIHQIESFNDFITFGIQDIINQEANSISFPHYKLKFGQIHVARPSVIEEDRSDHILYPMDARRRDLNYDAALHVDITEEYTDGDKTEVKHFNRVLIGRIPIMLNSSLCNLTNLSDIERIEKGECAKDPGGYFIIKGNERVIVAQMRAVYNQVFVLRQKSDSKYKWIAESRSMSDETGHSVLIQALMNSDGRTLTFSIPYIKEPIPVGIVFKALGYTKDEEIINLIGLDHIKAREFYRYILRDSFLCATKEDAFNYISKYAMHIIDEKKEKEYSNQIVETEILPHIGISGTITEKACFLGRMVRKLLMTHLSLRKEDDRDAYYNKRIETTGNLMYDIFRNLFKKFVQFIKAQLEKRKQRPDIKTIITRTKNITKGLHTCLATGNWGVQKNANYVRTGVSQILDRMTYRASLSHLRRVIIPMVKEGKNAAIRQIHSSSFGFVCVTGDTLVTLHNLQKIQIKDITENHLVLTVSTSLKQEPSKIFNIFSIQPESLLQISVGDRTIKCTPDHPFLTYFYSNTDECAYNLWVKAGRLEKGNLVYIKNDSQILPLPISDIKTIQPEPVYDFTTVSDNHSFIANDFITHNCPSECFHPDTEILSWEGKIKKAKEIQVGDLLIDEKGESVRVKSTCSGVKAMYTIRHSNPDFTDYTVTDNHILTLKADRHNMITGYNIVSIFNKDTLKYEYQSFSSMIEAYDFTKINQNDGIIDITIDDYLKLDTDVKSTLKTFKCPTVNWAENSDDNNVINSKENRYNLLSKYTQNIGKLSEDGKWFVNLDCKEVDKIHFLCRSLGMSCHKDSKSLIIDFTIKDVFSDFVLELQPVQEFVGWQIDGNGRFLLGDFTVTHNTPEGQKVGVVLNLALMTRVTRKIPKVNVRNILETCKSITFLHDMKFEDMQEYAAVIYNGNIIGFSADPDETLNEIKRKRSRGLLDSEISIAYDVIDNDIRIFSDEGRLIRPLINLKDNRLRFDPSELFNKELFNKDSPKLSWRTMIQKGYIQYVDPSEIENSVIAMSPEYVRLQHNDFMEIHPTMMLGIMASMIPFADHSQSPRNCYQSSMGKQALGIPLLSYNLRTDTILHVLHYAQRPLVYTKAAELLGMNEMPSGINAIVAIAAYSGFNC
jgi:hypothetical protein